jgi:ribosomal protein S18 acetylase RimI-like enzyme
MVPNFVPLSAAGIPSALALREQLYLHEDLVCEPGDAPRLLQELLDNPQFGSLWLFKILGETAGYLLLTFCYSLEFHGRFALLDEFYVAERWRGQEIGSAALDFAERECRARGLHALRLEVMHANSRALNLYLRRGFAPDSPPTISR